MTSRKKVLDRIRKCLALSKSPEPHEAAAALRQARKLMEAHGVTVDEVDQAEIGECSVSTGQRESSRPVWLILLLNLVAHAFSCHPILGYERRPRIRSVATLVGRGNGPELATYAFTVLSRTLRKQRAA